MDAAGGAQRLLPSAISGSPTLSLTVNLASSLLYSIIWFVGVDGGDCVTLSCGSVVKVQHYMVMIQEFMSGGSLEDLVQDCNRNSNTWGIANA